MEDDEKGILAEGTPGISIKTIMTLLIAPVFWGGAFVAAKFTVQELAPITAAFFRFFIATLFLVPLLLIKEKDNWKAKGEDIPWLMLSGLTGVFAYNIFFFYGLQYTSAINGALIAASNPGITALLALFFLKERLNLVQIGGIILSFVGVLFVITKGSWETISQLAMNKGDILLIGATMSWAMYTLVGKKVLKIYSPLAATTYGIAFGTLFLLPFALKDLLTFNWLQISWEVAAALFFMAIFASVIAFVWWYEAVKEIGASRAAIFINLVPISAMGIAVFFGEALSLLEIFGASLVLSGVYLTSIKKG